MSEIKKNKFKITDGKGFHITFANGYTVSIQIGWGNYTENYKRLDWSDLYPKELENKKKGIYPETELAETAILDPKDDFVNYKDESVQGYQTPEEVLETLNYASKLK